MPPRACSILARDLPEAVDAALKFCISGNQGELPNAWSWYRTNWSSNRATIQSDDYDLECDFDYIMTPDNQWFRTYEVKVVRQNYPLNKKQRAELTRRNFMIGHRRVATHTASIPVPNPHYE